VPVPPVATGVLAFLIVLLWPNDSIVSGDEEHRMLEEHRRQPQRGANPQPGGLLAPAPNPNSNSAIPASLLPLGTGPNERRYPHQTCENQVLDELQTAMHSVCDRIPGESCSPSKVSRKRLERRSCSQIRLRIQALRECIRLRQEIQNQCFGGMPDPVHERAITELQSGLDACLALEAINCAPGHPMANL
jgi:hypothetical protein